MSRIKNLLVKIKGKAFFIKAEEIKGRIWFHLNGKIFVLNRDEVKKTSLPGSSSKEQSKSADIMSPMPGKIVKIPVKTGAKVKDAQTLVILSSMKMEYTVKSLGKGVVRSISVREGDRVSADQKLMEVCYT